MNNKNKKKDRIQLTEIFTAKAGIGNSGFDRCFHGTIRRELDANGNTVVYGRINVNDDYILAMAKDQWELGNKLDELVLMVLDYGLNDIAAKSIEIANVPFNLN